MNRSIVNICLIIVCVFISCTNSYLEQSQVPLILSDPFVESFKDKGIISQISYTESSPDMTDTVNFDSEGRITSKVDYYSRKEYEYDSNGNVSRMLLYTDTPINYLLEYKRERNSVFQTWYPIKHLRWEYSKNDLDSAERVIEFKLNVNGQVEEELDLSSGEITKYEYEGDKLMTKEAFINIDSEPTKKWNYQYDQDGTLIKAEIYSRNRLLIEHFFGSTGLLDSTRRNNYSLIYKYKFQE